MTYNQIIKRIKELKELQEKAVVARKELREKTVCCGHGDFHGTGEYKVVYVYEKDEERVEELQKEIDALEILIKDEKERRKVIEKRKRLLKELEDLNSRKAYIEQWLAEHGA